MFGWFKKLVKEETLKDILLDITRHDIFGNPFLDFLGSNKSMHKYSSLGKYTFNLYNISPSKLRKISQIPIQNIADYSLGSYDIVVDVSIKEYDKFYKNSGIQLLRTSIERALQRYSKIDIYKKEIIDELYLTPIIKIRDTVYNEMVDHDFIKISYDIINQFCEDIETDNKNEKSDMVDSLKDDLEFIKRIREKRI